MKIKNEQFFRTIRSFFEIYLVKNRSCSPNTVKSYKDALNLYLDFLEAEKNVPATKADWKCFNSQFVQEFLIWLEETRGCSKQTQRQRLTAIRSFIQYGGILDVCTVAIQADVEKINVVIPFKQPEQSPDYGIYRRVKSSHEPKVEGKSHGKEQAVSSGGIHERVFHRGKMPGVYGKFAVGRRICLPEMRLPPRLSAIQWSLSMCRLPQANLSDSGNSASQEPYATDAVVSGILFCEPG